MAKESYEIKTKKGYDFFQVASAFQKSIRRCDEEQSTFWGIELYESGYQSYAWKRMVIMASEDVGLGDPDVIVKIMALKQSYDFLSSKNERSLPERLPFMQAVLLLTRCMKSRYVDHAITYYWQTHKDKFLEMPDYAYDMHTRKGKAMGRGLKYFYEESVKTNNSNKIKGEERMEALAMEVDNVFGVERIDMNHDDTEAIIKSKSKPRQTDLFAELE